MPYKPQSEPGKSLYQPDVQITQLGEKIGDPVIAADFPEHILRFRNDRWDQSVGLHDLSDEQWISHFGRFEPLADNLDPPLALRYHGHQFRTYNPEIGDGRGFLFAQLRDHEQRLMDLATKGSGTTPWSREILATEMLEALGVNTSKTFSVVETGEKLMRGDEPSPTRSAVMTRLSHGHIRIGTFQRIAYEKNEELMHRLVTYCLEQYYGGARTENPAAELFEKVTQEVARLAGAYMTAGFVHGVLNTDNINISGESFDYGPWRFTPYWEPGFTAAYFDHEGLYCFARQPEALHWNLAQLASALRLIADSEPLVATLESFPKAYGTAFTEHFCWRLGIQSEGFEKDRDLVVAAEKGLAQRTIQIDRFFFDWGKADNLADPEDDSSEFSGFRNLVADRSRTRMPASSYWQKPEPCSMHIEEVESIWASIADHDNWTPLSEKIKDIRDMGVALRKG